MPGEPWGRSSALGDIGAALLARRMILVHGPVDGSRTAEVAASLMMLDATGDDRIVVRLTAADASVETGLTLMDTIGILGVPVDTVGAGIVAGGAVGVLAAGRRRTLAPHARLHLHEPEGSVAGRAVDIERQVAEQASRRDRFYDELSCSTGRPPGEIAAEWSSGRYLEAADAVTLGYADSLEQSRDAQPGDLP